MSLRNRPRLALSVTDAATLERIWNEHAASVLGMLKTYCASPEDAQDTLQELFLRVGKNPSVVQSAKSPRAFLIVSARRIAIDAARKRASDQRREESTEAAEAVHPSPVAPKNDGDLAAAISKALAELPPEQRSVFEAKVLHGKTLAVIATEQSITLNTAASRLRYSLDKIRTRLRPHYEAMKNQTTKSNTLSDSTARLIKPLEPKRVPSVVPGLEGVAAFAVADSHIESIDAHEPILCVCPAPVEIPAPEPVDHAVHVDPVIPEPETYDPSSETVDHTPDDHVDPMVTQEVEPTDVEVHGDQVGDESSSASEEDLSHNPDDSSDGSTELLTAIFESNFSSEEGAEGHSDESDINFIDLNESHDSVSEEETPILGEFFNIEIQPEHSDGEFTDAVGISECSELDYNEYLLREYKSFLADNPDWLEAHAGGDIQAQVITSSEYTGIEWENPGAARCFDQWFHATYIAPTDAVGIPEFSEHDYNEYLLREYKSFLGDNPDWLEAHAGGDIQAQVITSSEYTGIEWENPGAARCFDQWFHATYIAPYEGSAPVEGGTLLVAPDLGYHETRVVSGETENSTWTDAGSLEICGGGFINGALMRGGTLELSGDQLIVNNTVAMPGQIAGGVSTLGLSGGSLLSLSGAGVINTENLLTTKSDPSVPVLGETSQTIVTGGRVVAADPIEGSFTVENGGSVSIGDRVIGEGTYNFNAETAMDSESQAVSAVASPVDAASATVKPEHTAEAHETAPIGFSVTPIVSGSNSPISTEEVHGMHAGHDATKLANLHTPSPASVELPVLIHSQEIQHLDAGSDHETGITFVDDDTYVAPASPDMNAVPVGVPASATHDVAAAIGGAFVAGSATQVAPAAKSLSPRKSLIA
jgi:RNA polymerase sigma-70 factor (ECF subfamily)